VPPEKQHAFSNAWPGGSFLTAALLIGSGAFQLSWHVLRVLSLNDPVYGLIEKHKMAYASLNAVFREKSRMERAAQSFDDNLELAALSADPLVTDLRCIEEGLGKLPGLSNHQKVRAPTCGTESQILCEVLFHWELCDAQSQR
jgi:hypothetical protein